MGGEVEYGSGWRSARAGVSERGQARSVVVEGREPCLESSIDRARHHCCQCALRPRQAARPPLVPTWRSSVRGSARGLSLVLAKQFDVFSDYLPDSSTMQKENSHTPDNHQYVGPYRLEKTLGKGQTGKSSASSSATS